MRSIYIKHILLTEPTTAGHFIYDVPVNPGKVLVIKNLSVTFPGFKTNEAGEFFIVDSTRKIYINDDSPHKLGGQASWTGNLAIGEGDKIGCYLSGTATGNLIVLCVIGELWDLEDWRNCGNISK